MSLFFLSGILTIITEIILILFLINKIFKKNKKIYWILILNFYSIFCWGITIIMLYMFNHDSSISYLIWKLTHLGIVFIPSSTLHIIMIITQSRNLKYIKYSYIISMFYMILGLFYKDFLNNVTFLYDEIYYIQGDSFIYYTFIFYFLSSFLYAITLIHKIKKRFNEWKNEFYIGLLTSCIGGLTSFLPVLGYHFYYPYGNLLTPIYSLMIFYSILKYKFLDIEIDFNYKFKQLVSFIISIIIFNITPNIMDVIFITETIKILLSIFVYIKTMEFLTSDWFNKNYYVGSQKFFKKTINKSIDDNYSIIHEINHNFIKNTKQLKINNCKIVSLINDHKEKHYKEIVNYFKKNSEYLNINNEKHINIINNKNIEMIFPIFSNDVLMGLIFIGKKQNNKQYTKIEIQVFNDFTKKLISIFINTEYKKILREEIKEKIIELNNRNQSLIAITYKQNDFISMLTHEVRAPISTARGIMEEIIDEAEENYKEDNIIKKNIIKVDSLLKNLINITDSIFESQKEKINQYYSLKEVISAGDYIEKICSYYDNIFKKNNIDFTLNIKSNEKILIDINKFQQVMSNLIGNAMKFSDKNIIKIDSESIQDHIFISVYNSGPIISNEDSEKIFNKFYKKGQNQGLGYGLSLCKNIIEHHDGEIFAEKNRTEGVKIVIKFPIVQYVNKEATENIQI